MHSRRTFLASVGAGALLGLAGCSGPLLGSGPNESPPSTVGSDWTPDGGTWATVGCDPRNSRAVGAGPGDETAPTVAATLGEGNGSAATVLGATPSAVYLGGADGTIRAVGTDGWDERWARSFSGGGRAPGGVVDGTLYLAGEGRVRALATGGDERWAVDHHGTLEGSVGDEWLENSPSLFGPHVVPTPALLYAVSSYGFHGLAPADGTERWRVVFPDAPLSRPEGAAVTADAVWTTAGDTLFRLATGGNGVALTAARLPGSVGPPTAAPPGALLAPRGGTTRPPYTLAAYGADALGSPSDPPTSSPAWRVRLHPDRDGEVYGVTRPAVADGRAVVGQAVATATDGERRQVATVAAVDAETGERAWRYDLPGADPEGRTAATGRLLSDPVVADGTVLVGVGTRTTAEESLVAEPGVVLALDAASGEELWRASPGVVPRHLTVAGDHCYVADGEGRVAVLG